MHHKKQVIKFGYLQALSVENDTLANGEVQKLNWSNTYHKNETEEHQTYFWKVVVFRKINKSQTYRMCKLKKN